MGEGEGAAVYFVFLNPQKERLFIMDEKYEKTFSHYAFSMCNLSENQCANYNSLKLICFGDFLIREIFPC